MKTTLRIAVSVFSYTIFAFIFFIVKAFFIKDISGIFAEDTAYWRFITGLCGFLNWLPAILTSVSCITFSWLFGRDTGKNLAKFSPVQLKNYKTVLFVAGVSVALCFAAVEVFLPIAEAVKSRLENRIQDYTWYIEHSEEAYKNANASAAVFYAENALLLRPGDSEAKRLRDAALNLAARGEYTPPEAMALIPSDISEMESSPYSGILLLKKSRSAFEEKKFFDAHYYASWALKLIGDDNENSAELRRIAVESWKIISEWSGFETDEASRIFLKKRNGYIALMEGDVLDAYYIFSDLYKVSNFDPDIVRFYRLSTEALLNQYFFIDEVQNLAFFEKFKNISFTIKKPDGSVDAIKIGGVTPVLQTGNLVKYLRNYSCTTYEADGRLRAVLSVPYVKLTAQKAGSFGSDYERVTGIEDPETYIPCLLCTSVDRKNRGIVISPQYTSVINENRLQEPVQILPMGLKDFDLICDAADKGPLYMNLLSLFRFVPIAERYGLPQRLYQTFLLQRFTRPLFLFAVFIFLAVIAWNFKLASSQMFRFVWLFSFPIFTVLAQFCIEFFQYLITLIAYTLTVFSPDIQLPIALILLFALIVTLSVRFLSLYEISADD